MTDRDAPKVVSETGNPDRVEIIWYVPDCGYIHAGDPRQTTIPAHCPDNVPADAAPREVAHAAGPGLDVEVLRQADLIDRLRTECLALPTMDVIIGPWPNAGTAPAVLLPAVLRIIEKLEAEG